MDKRSLIILDELHKAKLWKRNIKGLYDTQKGLYDFLVTGSARLNIYRKGSDSLLGRYYHFRLHPFSVAELLKNKFSLAPDELIKKIFSDGNKPPEGTEDILKLLFDFGPFPEPLFAEDYQVLNLWQRNRTEKIRKNLKLIFLSSVIKSLF